MHAILRHLQGMLWRRRQFATGYRLLYKNIPTTSQGFEVKKKVNIEGVEDIATPSMLRSVWVESVCSSTIASMLEN